MKHTTMKHAAATLLVSGLCWAPGLQAQAGPGKTPLQELVPPMSATGSKVTGSGKGRKATITVTNTGKLGVVRYEMTMFFLGPDGSVGKSVPHTGTPRPALGPGKETVVKPAALFMKDDTASVAGVVTALVFEDGSRWPPAPADPPARKGDAPVGIAPLGFIGKAPLSMPAVACYNHGKKDVSGVMYYIEFLDGKGGKLGSSNYGYNGDTENPFLKSGTGAVLCVGEPLPAGTKQFRLSLTNVFFADETLWQAKEFR